MKGFIFCLVFIAGCAASHPYSANRSVERFVVPKEPIAMAAPVTRPPLLPKPLVVIDPGHGGEDTGTQASAKAEEKQLTLTTAQMLKEYLRQLGYPTVMTRSEDRFVGLEARAVLANQRGAALFVSVHYNAAPKAPEASGIEVFYHVNEANKAKTEASQALAARVLAQVVDATKAKSRGVKKANFVVIRQTEMPAILVEGGFLTNIAEREKIENPAYLRRLAWGIAQGVDSYMKAANPIALRSAAGAEQSVLLKGDGSQKGAEKRKG